MPPKCHPHDSGALAKLDISSNRICGVYIISGTEFGTYDASGLEALAKAINNLKELNISSNLIKAEGAKILAPAIQDMGALAKLDISSNQICGIYLDYDGDEEGTYDASGLEALAKVIGNLKEFNISSNLIKSEGVKILAPAIQDNGALASLDISKNDIGSEQAEQIKKTCDQKSITCIC